MHRAASLSLSFALFTSLPAPAVFLSTSSLPGMSLPSVSVNETLRAILTNDFFKSFIYSGSCSNPPPPNTHTPLCVQHAYIFWPDAVTNRLSLHQLPGRTDLSVSLHLLHICNRHKGASTGAHYAADTHTHTQEARVGGLTADLHRGCLLLTFRENPRLPL